MAIRTQLPTVSVVALGGTIAMTGDGAGVVPRITSAQLVSSVPSLHAVATIEVHNFRQTPGASLTLDDIYAVADVIEERLESGAAGVVVTQGTDTIEETAYLLDLLLHRNAPVVLTGAMRNPTLPGADGPANLYAAVVVAASRVDLGGVVVVLGDEVHSGRRVTKGHSVSPAAFSSPGSGPLGLVVENRLLKLGVSASPRITVPRGKAGTPSVPIITVGLDDDGRGLRAAVGADAVVLEALGAGHVPEKLVEPIAALAREIPVVMTSRTRNGPVLRATYGFAGSEMDLRSRGVLVAGMLDTLRVRILLLALLRAGESIVDIRRRLRRLDAGE